MAERPRSTEQAACKALAGPPPAQLCLLRQVVQRRVSMAWPRNMLHLLNRGRTQASRPLQQLSPCLRFFSEEPKPTEATSSLRDSSERQEEDTRGVWLPQSPGSSSGESPGRQRMQPLRRPAPAAVPPPQKPKRGPESAAAAAAGEGGTPGAQPPATPPPPRAPPRPLPDSALWRPVSDPASDPAAAAARADAADPRGAPTPPGALPEGLPPRERPPPPPTEPPPVQAPPEVQRLGMLLAADCAALPLPRLIVSTPRARMEPLDLLDALEFVKAKARRRFVESVEVAINLGTDPRRGDQAVRGATTLPWGTGREARVAVFTASPEAQEAARAAGAEVVGADDLIASIQESGKVDFDKCLATPDAMPRLARVGRILGPKGLMPNPKLGTVVAPPGLPAAVAGLKKGRVEYRADKGAVLHAPLGRVSFPTEHLAANFAALGAAVLAARPRGVKGGTLAGYWRRVHLSSTMGPAVPVTLASALQAAQAARLAA